MEQTKRMILTSKINIKFKIIHYSPEYFQNYKFDDCQEIKTFDAM